MDALPYDDDPAGPREIDVQPHKIPLRGIDKLHLDIFLCVLDFIPLQYDRFNMLVVCRWWNENLRSRIWASISIGCWYQLKTVVKRINENRDLGRLVHELRIAHIPSRIFDEDPDESLFLGMEMLVIDDTGIADGVFDDAEIPDADMAGADMADPEVVEPEIFGPDTVDPDSGESEPDTELLAEEAECAAIAESVLYRNIPWPSTDIVEMCRNAVHNSDVHSWLLVLLLLLPNLRIFEVSKRLAWEDMQDLFDIFASFAGPSGPFSNSTGVFLKLEQFRVISSYRSHTSWTVFFAGACFPVLHLPALRVLHLDLTLFNFEETLHWSRVPFFPAPKSLSIRELHLRTATADMFGVTDLIHACKHLVFFSWQFSGYGSDPSHDVESYGQGIVNWGDDPESLPLIPIHKGLLPHSETLETLRYNDIDVYGAPDNHADPCFWFGPMSHFTVLRVLRIRFQHFINPECSLSKLLPPLLQQLTITGAGPRDLDDLIDTLLSILEASPFLIPQLRALTLEYVFVYEDSDDERIANHRCEDCQLGGCDQCLTMLLGPVKSLCHRYGIQWTWVRQPPPLEL